METKKNNGRRGDKRKYEITTNEGFKYFMVVGMGLRRGMEKEGFEFKEVSK